MIGPGATRGGAPGVRRGKLGNRETCDLEGRRDHGIGVERVIGLPSSPSETKLRPNCASLRRLLLN